MSTLTKESWQALTDSHGGPERRLLEEHLKKIIEHASSEGRQEKKYWNPPTFEFGGYRTYPVQIQGVQLGENGLLNLSGIIDYKNHTIHCADLQDKQVRITEYCPFKKTFKAFEVLR